MSTAASVHVRIVGLALIATTLPLVAQERRPRVALDVSVGVSEQLTDRLNGWCGPRASLAGTVGAVWRPVRLLVVEGVAARATGFRPRDCPSYPPASLPPQGRFVLGSVDYDRDPDAGPQLATALRAGVEVGTRAARLRLLGGAGRMWEARLPYRSLTAALTLGRGAARVLVEADHWRYDPPGLTRDVVVVDGAEVSRAERRFRLAESVLYGRVGVELVPRARRGT